jgi:hypothetical protein
MDANLCPLYLATAAKLARESHVVFIYSFTACPVRWMVPRPGDEEVVAFDCPIVLEGIRGEASVRAAQGRWLISSRS